MAKRHRRRPPVAVAYILIFMLGACAGKIDATPEGLARALTKSNVAVAQAAEAERAARAHAMRGDWRNAARFVDAAVFAFKDVRRVHAAVVDAHQSAVAEHRAAVEAFRLAHARPGRTAPQVAGLSPLYGVGRTLGGHAAASDGAVALVAERMASTQIALTSARHNVAVVERVVAQLKRLDRTTTARPASTSLAPDATTLDEPALVLPPDVNFDQEVLGAQR